MLSKRRTRKTTKKDVDSDEVENDIPAKLPRKSLRKKATPALLFKKHREKEPENDYDADSETEFNTKVENNTEYANSGITNAQMEEAPILDSECFETIDKAKNLGLTKLMTKIMDCSVSLKRMSTTPLNYSSMDSSDTEKQSIFKIPTAKTTLKRTDKENVTPPDSHSTPALLKLASRKLDSSLFGFEFLSDTPSSQLPFSPVPSKYNNTKTEISCQSQLSTLSSFSNITSPNKRKHEKELPYDMPIVPKKRQRKKNKNTVNTEDVADKELEMLRSQFEEVEMHQLAVE